MTKELKTFILNTGDDNKVILLRIIVGLIVLSEGFWARAHEYRTDFAMTVLLIYLLIYGSGSLSIDSKINKSLKHEL
jgi:uncharacterized membrane protein YphA (DoxX/SURF4 family)